MNAKNDFVFLICTVSKHPLLCHLEAVPNAVTQACSMPLKKVAGFCLVITQNIAGSVIIAWIRRPTITVIMYKLNI